MNEENNQKVYLISRLNRPVSVVVGENGEQTSLAPYANRVGPFESSDVQSPLPSGVIQVNEGE